ncbi:MAG: hypothetical protein H0U16_04870 [Actinobacteria bacterium]|nr:hypothetical protein [Actinomycetota bacterium]
MGSLEDKLEKWEDLGLISHEQSVAIEEAEARVPHGSRSVPLITEALGYAGSSLVVIAIILAGSQLWDRFGVVAETVVLGIATSLLFGAGFLLRRSAEPALQRLVSFLWALSAASFGYMVETVQDLPAFSTDRVELLATGVGSALYSGWLWRARQTGLQQIAVFTSLLVAIGGGIEASQGPPADWSPWYGGALWALGVCWLVLARVEWATPRSVAYPLAAGAMIVGPMVMAFSGQEGAYFGVATAVFLIALSVPWRSTVLLAFGVAGLFVTIPDIIFHFAGQAGAAVAFLASGIILLAVALLTARIKRLISTPEPEFPIPG